jgi:WhiB family redox-sensing transcriptional regulator
VDSNTKPTMHKVGTRQRCGLTSAAPPIVRNAEAWGWQLLARCRGTDTSVFFHPDGERGRKRRKRQQNAKRFCAQCPVTMQCLEYSLRFREPYGIWGGIAEDERHKILEHTIASARDRRKSTDRECLDVQAQQSVPAANKAGDV